MNSVMQQIIIISVVLCLFPFKQFIQAAEKKQDSLPANVIINPENGNKIFVDQLMLTIRQEITKDETENLFNSFGLKTVSCAPSLNIYQLSFSNPDASFKRYKELSRKLSNDPRVISVTSCKLNVYKDSSLHLADEEKVERSGGIRLTATEDVINQIKPRTIQTTINQHRYSLYTCIEKKQRLLKNYHGSVDLKIKITPSGRVAKVIATRTSISDRKLISCLKSQILKWNDFPKNMQSSSLRSAEFTFAF